MDDGIGFLAAMVGVAIGIFWLGPKMNGCEGRRERLEVRCGDVCHPHPGTFNSRHGGCDCEISKVVKSLPLEGK